MTLMLKNLSFLAAWIALAIFTGCSVTGIPTPDTINAKLAISYSAVTQARVTATDLLIAKKISAEDAQNVLQQTDNVRAALDLARSISRTDLRAAEDKLNTARVILLELQAYLDRKK